MALDVLVKVQKGRVKKEEASKETGGVLSRVRRRIFPDSPLRREEEREEFLLEGAGEILQRVSGLNSAGLRRDLFRLSGDILGRREEFLLMVSR